MLLGLSNGLLKAQIGYVQQGLAACYAASAEGRPTASGESFRAAVLTAAHRELPFGALLRVTVIQSDKSTVVCVNDRGPYTDAHIIDLSPAAVEALGLSPTQTAEVKIEVIGIAEGSGCLRWHDTRKAADLFAKKFPPKTTTPTPPPTSSGKSSTSTSSATGDARLRAPGTYDANGKPQSIAGQWGVQVGSFRSLANAQQALARVKTAGFSKVFLQLTGTAEVDHRVLVGAHKSKSAAQKAAAQLKKKGFSPTVVQHR